MYSLNPAGSFGVCKNNRTTTLVKFVLDIIYNNIVIRIVVGYVWNIISCSSSATSEKKTVLE